MSIDGLGGILTAALAIIAVSTLAGYGLLRGRVASLRDELKDERDARESLHGRHQETLRDLVDCQGKLKVLESVVTGEIHWVALGEKLDHHHNEAKTQWTAQAVLLGEIRDLLRDQRTA
jgi:hypothetical protein